MRFFKIFILILSVYLNVLAGAVYTRIIESPSESWRADFSWRRSGQIFFVDPPRYPTDEAVISATTRDLNVRVEERHSAGLYSITVNSLHLHSAWNYWAKVIPNHQNYPLYLNSTVGDRTYIYVLGHGQIDTEVRVLKDLSVILYNKAHLNLNGMITDEYVQEIFFDSQDPPTHLPFSNIVALNITGEGTVVFSHLNTYRGGTNLSGNTITEIHNYQSLGIDAAISLLVSRFDCTD